MTILWIVCFMLRLCACLWFITTPFKFHLADIKSNGKLLAPLFRSIKNELGFAGFLPLLRTRSLPIRNKFSTLLQFPDEQQKTQLKLLTEHIDVKFRQDDISLFNNIDLILKFWRTDLEGFITRIKSLEIFPKLRSAPQATWLSYLRDFGTQSWDLTVSLLGTSPNLISTRELCSAIAAKQVFPSFNMGVWRIVDGECLRGLQTDSHLIKFLRKLLVPRQINFQDMGGVGPIVGLLHLAVAIEYLGVLSSGGVYGGSYSLITSASRRVLAEFQLAIAYAKNVPGNDDPELILIYKHMFSNLQKVIEEPQEPFGSTDGLYMLLGKLWKIPTNFDVSMAIISALTMLGASPEVDLAFLQSNLNNLFVTVSREHIPRRSLYTLLVILATRNEENLNLIVSQLWTYLQLGPDSVETILGINFTCFGPLATLALAHDPQGLKSFIRKDIMKRIKGSDLKRLEEIVKLESGDPLIHIDSKDSIIASIDRILASQFFAVSTFEGRPVYLPKIQLHPFIESGFWQLLQLALVYNANLNHFFLHPVYMLHVFSPPTARNEPAKMLAEVIIPAQFYSCGEKDLLAAWVLELDILLITQTFISQFIGNSAHDYRMYQELQSRSDRSVTQDTWVRLSSEGKQETYRANLESFGTCVWAQRQGVSWYTELLLRMSNAHDIQQILFKTPL